MNLEKKPFLDIKDVFNRFQEELAELVVEAGECSKAISKMRRFGTFSFHKSGLTGIEHLSQKMQKMQEEWDDVCLCMMEAEKRVANGELSELADWK